MDNKTPFLCIIRVGLCIIKIMDIVCNTSFSQKTSSLTQFEIFCLSTFDLPWCLYLFPMSWPCISWNAQQSKGSYLWYKTFKGYTPKQQPCCEEKSNGCIWTKSKSVLQNALPKLQDDNVGADSLSSQSIFDQDKILMDT